MTADSIKRAQYYRAAMDYLEIAERKRDWKLFDDIPWEKIDRSKNSEQKATCIETFCAEEMYLPDYSSHGARMTRDIFGAAWFQARWSFEESRHGLAFREYLLRSGMRSEEAIRCARRNGFLAQLDSSVPDRAADVLLRRDPGRRHLYRVQGAEGQSRTRRRFGAEGHFHQRRQRRGRARGFLSQGR